jgi:hypothetical protein
MNIVQISDAAAPYKTIDEALDAGLRTLLALGWSPVSVAAAEQPGGYFVHITGTVPYRGPGGRATRKKRVPMSAQVGRVTQEEK